MRQRLCLALNIALTIIALFATIACSSTKHVPQGEYLLDNVDINIENKVRKSNVNTNELFNYLRQTPNHKVLGGIKLQLALYNLSGKDSTKLLNKWARRLGTAPVIYDQSLTDASVSQLQMALVNKGYMDVSVNFDTVRKEKKRKINVAYNISLKEPHYIGKISYNIPNDTLRKLILADSARFLIKPNDLFDRNELEKERQLITERLRERGYYAFNKEYITFSADTAADSKSVYLTLNTMPPYPNEKMRYYTSHKPFFIRNVVFVTNYDPLTMHSTADYHAQDSINYKGFSILSDGNAYLRPGILEECCFIDPGHQYNSANVNKTYQALGRLGILKFINIELQPVGEIDGKIWLDAYILLTKGKSQSVSLSLEGTNSEGDLGFGIGAGYQHRNIGHGAEVLNTKLRASYESLSGDLSGLINDNYSEYDGEIGITFPKFKCPFLQRSFKQKILATTELSTMFNYQERPEYTRVIAGAAWKYHWSEKRHNTRHVFNLLDINYVYLPKSRSNFLDSIKNPLLRYSYENHFIMRMGYSFYHSNKRTPGPFDKAFQTNIYTIRAAAETAGNLLYAISNMTGEQRKNEAYEVFGIRYAQYVKFEGDYSLTHAFNTRSSLAFHVGAGAAVPYGNSTVLPFEKRFYAGGANGVRGWGVRTLGPGSFNGDNSVNSFIYKCGDIRLDLNIESRTKLFWVVELGAFVDAGNIWTIRNYEDQPGGQFKFNKFYEQIAIAYGLGLRLDFTYFLLRFDLGMKAHNPAEGQERWPILHPNWNRDAAFHFSVGYPF